jgi:hypothetical protein
MKKRTWTCLLLGAVISASVLCVGWGKKDRTADELDKIAAVGGGLVLDASARGVDDLMKLAVLSAGSGSTLFLKDCGGFETADLMKIAAAGAGHVVIEF